MTLAFDPELHEYSSNGVRMISVTQALKAAGLIDDRWFTQWAADRGSRVHKAIQYHCEGELDVDSIDLNDRGYFDAYLKFEAENHWRPISIEHHVWDEGRGFAGTLDAAGDIKGRPSIVDYKTGPANRAVGIQLTGYHIGATGHHIGAGFKNHQLVSVHLKHDGTYKMKTHKFEPLVFLAALTIAKWKEAAWLSGS